MTGGPLLQGILAGLLLSALAASGCASTGSSKAPVASASDAMDAGRWVTGTVVDEEFRPVSGAQVAHSASNRTASTDEAGRFRLERLPALAEVVIDAQHPGFRPLSLRVDLLYVPSAEVRFVLAAASSGASHHKTVESAGEVTCQVAFGSHHGFPGFYRESCARATGDSKERIRVAVDPNVTAAIVELAWTPQSQFADIMGLTLYLSTDREEVMIAGVHSLAGDHYVSVYTGTNAVESARPQGGVLDSFIHVDPSALEEHVPTNVGVVVQQKFTLYTTAFYGDPPAPTWSAVKARP